MEQSGISEIVINSLYTIKRNESSDSDTCRLVGIRSGYLGGGEEPTQYLLFKSLKNGDTIARAIPLVNPILEDNGIFPIKPVSSEKLICRLNDKKSVYAVIGISPIFDPNCFYFFYCHPDGTVKDAHINKVSYLDLLTDINDRITFFLRVNGNVPDLNGKGLWFSSLISDIVQVHEKYPEIRKFVEDNYVVDTNVGIFFK